MSFILACDSACNLPQEVIDRYGISVVPTTYYDERHPERLMSSTLKDGFDPEDFYHQMEEGVIFKTAVVNYGDCANTLDSVLEASDDDVLFIVFSSGLTTTIDSITSYFDSVRNKYPGRKLIVVDSLSAGLGMGALVLRAAEMQEAGASIEEAATWVQDNRLKTCLWFTVDDLKYLVRGGRVPAASAMVAGALNIKPVLHFNDEGKMVAVGKARGRKKAWTAMLDALEERAFQPVNEQMIFIAHAACPDGVEFLQEKLRERHGIERFMVNYIDPVIGAHAGPGAIGMFYSGTPR